MIEHNVLIKIRNGVDISAKNDLIIHTKDLESVPGVIRVCGGFNVTDENVTPRYDIYLRVYFQSREALRNYLAHPTHRNFADSYIHPIKDCLTVFDLEI